MKKIVKKKIKKIAKSKVDDDSAIFRIKEVSTQLFADHGFDSVSVRQIAKAANVNVAMINYYFRSKEELYKTVVHEFALHVQKQVDDILLPLISQDFDRPLFEKQMQLFFKHFVDHIFEHHQMFRLMQREVLSGLPYCRPTYENVFTLIRNKMISILTLAQKKSILKKELHPGLFLFFMIHSIEQLALAAQCDPLLMETLPDTKNANSNIAEQVYLIFIKGGLK
jgi:AcrR family transcriptional regulator